MADCPRSGIHWSLRLLKEASNSSLDVSSETRIDTVEPGREGGRRNVPVSVTGNRPAVRGLFTETPFVFEPPYSAIEDQQAFIGAR
jgi:hypothetical protein